MSLLSIVSLSLPLYVMGQYNSIPWNYPEISQYFHVLTYHQICIMGYQTYESLEKKKIDKCICFVINRQVHGLVIENQCYHVRSLEDAIRYAKELYPNKKRFLMGGSKTFQDAFEKKLIEKIYIVKIDKIYVGDVFFPKEYLESFSKQKEVPSQHFIEITYQEWNHHSFL